MWVLPARAFTPTLAVLPRRIAWSPTIRGVVRRGVPLCFATGTALLLQPKPPVRAESIACANGVEALLDKSGELILPPLPERHRLELIRRAFVIFFRWAPVILLSPLLWIREEWWWHIVLETIERSGPCFIKLAQWASTRLDFFPEELCNRLCAFQAHCRIHQWEHTERILDDAFGPSWPKHLAIQHQPLGSGAVAQVYRGTLVEEDGKSTTVAIKVCHPNARNHIELDLNLLASLATGLEWIMPSTKALAGPEMVRQFGLYLRSQLDMRIEARNIDRFQAEFKHVDHISFPVVQRPWVSTDVLVESFEAATLLADYIVDRPMLARTYSRRRQLDWPDAASTRPTTCPNYGTAGKEYRKQIAEEAVDMFLTMLFDNNFLHGDLHPGNMMIGVPPSITVIDCGLCIHISKRDARDFADVLKAFLSGDGAKCGELIVERSPGDRQLGRDKEIFIQEVSKIVNGMKEKGLRCGNMRVADPVARVLNLACHHRVLLEPNFVSVLLSIAVCEGLVQRLAPEMDIFKRMMPFLVRASARYVISG